MGSHMIMIFDNDFGVGFFRRHSKMALFSLSSSFSEASGRNNCSASCTDSGFGLQHRVKDTVLFLDFLATGNIFVLLRGRDKNIFFGICNP